MYSIFDFLLISRLLSQQDIVMSRSLKETRDWFIIIFSHRSKFKIEFLATYGNEIFVVIL